MVIDPVNAMFSFGSVCLYARSLTGIPDRVKWAGIGILTAALGLVAGEAQADQFKMAGDNARVECVVSKRDVTRISLVGDGFASLNKVATGSPYNDFSVVNEPVRGDIYLSVSDAYASKTVNFFATSKKGYVYKFVCQVAVVEAQQVFVTNPGLATAKAREWESETPVRETAVRLIRAMATFATVDGYEIRQPDAKPVVVGALQVRLIQEYRGASLLGKVLRIENHGAAPIKLREADVAPEGTLAITIADPVLGPGAVTTVDLVEQNGAH